MVHSSIHAQAESGDDAKLTWISPNEYREIIFLNGAWEYRSHDSQSWHTINLPGHMTSEVELSFRKLFSLDSTQSNRQYSLVCYGINEYVTIYLNSKFLGSHSGGYSSFKIDIPKNYFNFQGKNIFELIVQPTDAIKDHISMDQTFLIPDNQCCIYRDLYLMSLPSEYIELNDIDYKFDDSYGSVDISIFVNLAHIENLSDTKSISNRVINYQIYKKGYNKPVVNKWQDFNTENSSQLKLRLNTKMSSPVLWSPENPYLYRLVLTLYKGNKQIDILSRDIGFKDLEVKNQDLYLNGERLVIKGINYTGCTNVMDSSSMGLEEDFEILKNLNINCIRTYKYLPHPYFVDLCDKKGILLIQDVPFEWKPVKSFMGHYTEEAANDYIEDAFYRDHFNVSLLGIGVNQFFTLNDMDSNVYDPRFKKNFLLLNNVIAKNTSSLSNGSDGYIFNIYDLDSNFKYWESDISKDILNSHLVFTSILSPLKSADFFTERDSVANQKYQANQLSTVVNYIEDISKLDGIFINSLRDWRASYPLTFSRDTNDPHKFKSGILTDNNDPRVSYKLISSIFKEQSAYQNSIVKHKQLLPNIFPIIGIILVLLFLLVYNSRKYFQENLKRIFIHPHGFFVDIRDKRKIPISHTLLIIIFFSLGLGLIYTTIFYFYKTYFDFDHLLTLILISENFKSKFVTLLWQPEKMLLYISLFSFVFYLIVGFILYILAIILKKRVSLGQITTTTFWSCSIYLLFVPLGMILFRILLFNIFILPIYLSIIGIHVLFILRLSKSIKVMFYWSSNKSILLVMTLMVCVLAGIIYFYVRNYGSIDYFLFYLNNMI